jgi:hypothetical protein
MSVELQALLPSASKALRRLSPLTKRAGSGCRKITAWNLASAGWIGITDRIFLSLVERRVLGLVPSRLSARREAWPRKAE